MLEPLVSGGQPGLPGSAGAPGFCLLLHSPPAAHPGPRAHSMPTICPPPPTGVSLPEGVSVGPPFQSPLSIPQAKLLWIQGPPTVAILGFWAYVSVSRSWKMDASIYSQNRLGHSLSHMKSHD